MKAQGLGSRIRIRIVIRRVNTAITSEMNERCSGYYNFEPPGSAASTQSLPATPLAASFNVPSPPGVPESYERAEVDPRGLVVSGRWSLKL